MVHVFSLCFLQDGSVSGEASCMLWKWIFGKLLLQCDCSMQVSASLKCLSHGMTHTHTHIHSIRQCCHANVPTDPPTAKGVLVSQVRLSSGSSVTAVYPGSSSVGPSKSGGLTHKIFITL